MSIAVVIPTIAGREALLERTLTAYRSFPGIVPIIVRNRPTIGQAWNDGVAKALAIEGVEYLHLSADDVEPQRGWIEAATDAADRWIFPSPRILNIDGSLHSCGTMGAGMLMPECSTGTTCGASPFPFMRADKWHMLGPVPPIHYYADDYLGWSARQRCFDVEVVRDYLIVHLEGIAGRSRVAQRSAADRARFLATIGEERPA